MNMKVKIGISLIIFVITIVIIILLSSGIIINLINNNPVSDAVKLIYLSDLKNFQSELEVYKNNLSIYVPRRYNPESLQADSTSVTYNGMVDTTKTINDIIPALGESEKYDGEFKVIDGELVLAKYDTTKQEWAREIGIEIIAESEITVNIVSPIESSVGSGTDIVYTINFSSDLELTLIDLAGKIEVLDNNGVSLPIQPVITIGTVSGTSLDLIRHVDVTIKTGTLTIGIYKLKIKAGAAANINNVSNTEDSISPVGFSIDSALLENPIILQDLETWTNENVTATINYSNANFTNQYSTDGTNWYTYTVPIIIKVNNTTVYARVLDEVNNQIVQSKLIVRNIDKDIPSVNVPNVSSTSSSITVTAAATDESGSGINSYQYSKDNGLTWTLPIEDTSYTFTSISTGIYECKVKVLDNVGNVAISGAASISTQELGIITLVADPTGWTNGDVTVTITYPSQVVTNQYSVDGLIWDTYTTPINVTVNNTTIYAKGLDEGGNQTAQATLTVANIDKIVPVVLYETNSNLGSDISTKVTVSDTNGSGVNESTLQYIWDVQNTVIPNDEWITFTNGDNITNNIEGNYYLWIKAIDNVGNIVVTKSDLITVIILEYNISNEAVFEPEPVTNTLSVHSTINGKLPSYNNPVIPTGFGAVNTLDASWDNVLVDWNKGLVIQDMMGNQFVWVPVDGTNVTYEKWCTQGISHSNPNVSNDLLPAGVTSEIYQITTFGGFYIARCEAGLEGFDTLVSKKSATIWKGITYTKAKTSAEAMYNATLLKSGLITGTQWDTVMKWVQNSGKNILDSRTWGNYRNSVEPANISGFGSLQVSGYTEFWKANNIYGLGGNILEWSNELYKSNYAVARGGYHGDNGASVGASDRDNNSFTYQNDRSGFRCVLYLK